MNVALIPGAILTIMIFSYIIKDNLSFKFAESLFVGYTIAHQLVMTVDGLQSSVGGPLAKGNFVPIIGVLFGIVILTRLIPSLRYVSLWGIALVIGVSTALFTRGLLGSDIMGQITGTIGAGIVGTGQQIFDRIVMIIGVLTAMSYFIFTETTVGGRPIFQYPRSIGKYFLLIGFGVGYGMTFLSRMALLFGRVVDLLRAIGILA